MSFLILKGYVVQVKLPNVSGCMFARDLQIFGFFGSKKMQALVNAIVHVHNIQVIRVNLTLPSSVIVHELHKYMRTYLWAHA